MVAQNEKILFLSVFYFDFVFVNVIFARYGEICKNQDFVLYGLFWK